MKRANEVFSGINHVPSAHASDHITEGCIVLEGGALLGLYTAGVLDGLMLSDLNFRSTIGVSAGAMFGFCYVAGQIGLGARFNLQNRYNPQYIGVPAALKAHSPFNVQYAFDDSHLGTPFDAERFYKADRRFIAVACCVDTAETVYFEKGKCRDIFLGIQASATIPVVSGPVRINGKRYLDGGTSMNLPYEWAFEQGYEKVLVVKTRERSYRKAAAGMMKEKLFRTLYRNDPAFAELLVTQSDRYNRQCEVLDELEKQGRVFVIAPSRQISYDPLERDVEKLGRIYFQGLRDAKKYREDLKAYLRRP